MVRHIASLAAGLFVLMGSAEAAGFRTPAPPAPDPSWVAAVEEGDRVLLGRQSPAEAERAYSSALESVRQDASLGPAAESLVLDRLGQARAAQGHNEAAELSYLRSLVLRIGAPERGTATAESLENLADLYYQMGHNEEGLRVLQQSLALRERVFGTRSTEAAQSLSLLGTALRLQGSFEESERLLRRAVTILRDAAGNPCVRDELSLALGSLGELLVATGRAEEGDRLQREALGLPRSPPCPPSLGEDPRLLDGPG